MTPTLHLASLTFRVPNLARSIEFYAGQVGFVVQSYEPQRVRLAPSRDAAAILTLEEDPHAPPAPRDAAGLFHAALLFPDSRALGGWLQVAASRGVEFDGFSDHGVSEAIYFSDPDGNGLEFYADRPRADWPFRNGELAMTTRPLALPRLLAEATTRGTEPLAGTSWGHLHLRVTDLERSEAFYRDRLGLAVMQRSYPGARFLAADGYHHHVGLNTWGEPRQPKPPRALGLAEATFAHAVESAPRALVDPDGIALQLVPAGVLAVK
jgi:catechol 2,3-dioxygenase